MIQPMIKNLLILALAQGDADLARGESYIKELAKSWAARLPDELLLGIYAGSKYVGFARYHVRPASPEDRAAYEMTYETRGEMGGFKPTETMRALLDKDLNLLRARIANSGEHKPDRTTDYEVRDGRWFRTRVEADLVFDIDGPISQPMVWAPSHLVLLSPPSEPIALRSISSDPPFRFEASRTEIRSNRQVVHLDESRRVREILQTSGVRMRRIDETQMGKDLEIEKTEIPPPLRTVLDFFAACRENKGDAILELIDLDSLARSRNPEFPSMSEDKRKEFLAAIRKECAEFRMPVATDRLPRGEHLENFLGSLLKVEQQADTAKVSMPGDEESIHLKKTGDTWKILNFSHSSPESLKSHECERWGYALRAPARFRFEPLDRRQGSIVTQWQQDQGLNGFISSEPYLGKPADYLKRFVDILRDRGKVELLDQSPDRVTALINVDQQESVLIARTLCESRRALTFVAVCPPSRFDKERASLLAAAESLACAPAERIRRRCRSALWKFSLEVSDELAFKELQEPKGAFVAEFSSQRQRGYVAQEPFAGGVEEFAQALEKLYGQKDKSRILERSAAEGGASWVVEFTEGGRAVKERVRFLVLDKRVLRLHLGCLREEFEIYDDYFRKACDSFKGE
jgi:hypothetical protein